MATQQEIAEALGMDIEIVRNILNEVPGMSYDKETLDRVFQTARKMGYDLKKLKIGKRMEVRKAAIEDAIKYIEANPDWGRDEIIDYLKHSIGLVKRVQKKAFPEEFPAE
jgi:DNA-binding LacI/PurR family transcriptional regulator